MDTPYQNHSPVKVINDFSHDEDNREYTLVTEEVHLTFTSHSTIGSTPRTIDLYFIPTTSKDEQSFCYHLPYFTSSQNSTVISEYAIMNQPKTDRDLVEDATKFHQTEISKLWIREQKRKRI